MEKPRTPNMNKLQLVKALEAINTLEYMAGWIKPELQRLIDKEK